jgi:hypothetical protein
MNNQEKAKELRAQGLTYWDIGQQIGVSDTMARNYVLGIGNRRATGRENAPYACGKTRPGSNIVCQRRTRHDGVHLANDPGGRLIYWE